MKKYRLKIKDEEWLSREVIRALKFFYIQSKRGLSIETISTQILSSYGERVHYYMFLSINKHLTKTSS